MWRPRWREIRSASKNPATRRLLDEYLERDYTALGYQVQRVPIMSIQERCRFVATWLKEVGIELVLAQG